MSREVLKIGAYWPSLGQDGREQRQGGGLAALWRRAHSRFWKNLGNLGFVLKTAAGLWVATAALWAQGAELGRETLELELPETARGRLYPFIAGLSARPRWLPRGQVAVVAHSPGLFARLAWAGSEERGHLEGQVWVAEGKRARRLAARGPLSLAK